MRKIDTGLVDKEFIEKFKYYWKCGRFLTLYGSVQGFMIHITQRNRIYVNSFLRYVNPKNDKIIDELPNDVYIMLFHRGFMNRDMSLKKEMWSCRINDNIEELFKAIAKCNGLHGDYKIFMKEYFDNVKNNP